MEKDYIAPETLFASVGTAPVEAGSPAVAAGLDDSHSETRRLRKDGWDGGRMAAFCGTLAETGVVTLACRASGMSAQSAYGLRHRNPLFDKAWDAAISIARKRLADELLARSIRGGVEQLLKDGAIVAERQTFDNKLAFAVLRRLDRQAEFGATFRTPPRAELPAPAPAVEGRWQDLLDALSDDRPADAEHLLESPEVDFEVDNPPVGGGEGDLPDPADGENIAGSDDLPDPRLWWEPSRRGYRTNFPPPAGGDCFETGTVGDPGYERDLTDEEAALIAARDQSRAARRRAADEAQRDAFFASLRETEEEDGQVPPPSASPTPPPEEREGRTPPAPPPAPPGGGVGKADGGGPSRPQTPPRTNHCPRRGPSAKDDL